MLILNVTNNTQDLSKYKQTLRELKVSNQKVADYTGHTREYITLLLNGNANPPIKSAIHISEEIEEMIANKKRCYNPV